ncbi:MAG: iron-sulfur cluster assembly accessory protein [Chlorobiales bacterium]|nr:iron-sulfur cluster assembly accessory protein [Chlorobiales bacterium]
MSIKITDKAKQKIEELIGSGKVSPETIRLAAGCAGCSGISMGIDFNAATEASDTVLEQGGIRFHIAKELRHYMEDTTIDYADNEFGGSFIIQNPYGCNVCFV